MPFFTNSDTNDQDFDNLFREYYKSLRAYAYRYVNDPFIAEDIVQDVFFHIWDKREQLHKISSIRAYLFTSVFNRANTYLTHKKLEENYQKQKLESSGLDSYYQQQIDSVSESILALELEQQIREVINEMAPQCRKVFLMSREQGLKNREIAEQLGVSVSAIENHMKKALSMLRTKLKDYLVLWLLLFASLCSFLFS